MAAITWNSGGEARHDVNDASPHLPMLMPNGKRKTKPDYCRGEGANYLVYFCQDVPNHLCFNLVLYSNSQFLKLVITKMFC